MSSRLPFLLLGWIILFALGSLAIADPFATEANAGVAPDFWGSMYLHGMLTALVGLLALVTCQVFRVRSPSARLAIAASVVIATLATGIGGIFDTRLPGAEAATFVQNVGFFALDAMVVALIVGMIGEARRGPGPPARTLAFWVALSAALATLIAAILGHLAGWLLEFGAWPGFVAGYLRARGVDGGSFTAGLIVAHSRAMMTGVVALLVGLAAQQFGSRQLGRATRAALRTGLGMVLLGVAATTGLYVAMGLAGWQPPLIFAAGGGSGILLDQLVLGATVMLGGGVSIVALAGGRRGYRLLRVAAAWSWSLSFATVVLAGVAIELNESYFGAGAPWAAGAAQDAVFTWVHQDIGLFLFPALVLVAVMAERSLADRERGRIAGTMILGTTITFVGAMVWVFLDPTLHGPGYIVCSIGLVTLGGALVTAIIAGLRSGGAGARRARILSGPLPAGHRLAGHR